MIVNEKVRNLDLRSTRVYTLSDKVKEQPGMLLTNTDLITNKKGNARDIQLGRCYDLLGTDEYVWVPDHDDFSFGDSSNDNPFSISAWIYGDSLNGFWIMGKSDVSYGNEGREWEFYFGSDYKLYFYIHDDANSAHLRRYHNISYVSHESEWMYVVCTYDASKTLGGMKIYFNGIRVDDTQSSGGSYAAMNNTVRNIHIGRRFSSYSNGKIFDIRIHNKELTVSEIWNVMKGNASRYEVGWWKLDEGAGVVAHDSSGKMHHGLIKNATLSTLHVTDSGLPYSFQNNAGFNIAKLYNSSTTTSTTSTSTTSSSTSTTSTSSSTTSSSTTSISTSTTSTSSSTSTSTTSSSSSSTSSSTTTT